MPVDMDTATPGTVRTRLSGPQDGAFLRSLFASRCDHLHALGLPPAALQTLVDQQYACREADYARRYPQARTLIALAGQEPVAALVVHDDDARLHIVDLVVEPSARRRGHGRALVRQMQSLARSHGAGRHAVTLSVDPLNQPALRLYIALGFQPVDQQPHQWQMRWRAENDLRPRAAQEGAREDFLSTTTTTKG